MIVPTVPPVGGGAPGRWFMYTLTPGNRTISKSPALIAAPPMPTKIFWLAAMSRELRCKCPMVTPASLGVNGCAHAVPAVRLDASQSAAISFFMTDPCNSHVARTFGIEANATSRGGCGEPACGATAFDWGRRGSRVTCVALHIGERVGDRVVERGLDALAGRKHDPHDRHADECRHQSILDRGRAALIGEEASEVARQFGAESFWSHGPCPRFADYSSPVRCGMSGVSAGGIGYSFNRFGFTQASLWPSFGVTVPLQRRHT